MRVADVCVILVGDFPSWVKLGRLPRAEWLSRSILKSVLVHDYQHEVKPHECYLSFVQSCETIRNRRVFVFKNEKENKQNKTKTFFSFLFLF